MNKTDLRQLSLGDLQLFFEQQKLPAYRAKQVYEWIWMHCATGINEMTNLPLKLRDLLNQHFIINAIALHSQQVSGDGTIKSAFRLHDGHLIEGVLIPTASRTTACVSSQVGCSLTCSFCATGKMDRLRNLTAGEIFDQVARIREQALQQCGKPLTNIVYMGMGEPLLNYAAMMQSVHHVTSPEGLNMAAQRITVSTAGIAKMIHKLGDDEVRFNLALSLHAANDKKRNTIMPINEHNNLDALLVALKHFYNKTQSRVTFEYIVFNNFNDLLTDAQELLMFARQVPSKINLIEYNNVQGSDFKNASGNKISAFKNYLENNGMIVNIRKSRGKDIDAACGQLANKTTTNLT